MSSFWSSSLRLVILSILYICMVDNTLGLTKPNIVFVFADDWGFNEWGVNGCSCSQTSFIDNLAQTESLIIKHNYVTKICGPSRASFLTGRYPSHLGLQNYVFNPEITVSLTRQVSLLSEELSAAGYDTHLVGKWHLGMQSWEYTPTYRGFDSFYGFYGGWQSYFNHQQCVQPSYDDSIDYCFYDLRENEEPAFYPVNQELYGVWWERDKALDILETYVSDNSKPFFLYLSWQASHNPPEAPDDYVDLFDDCESDEDRQKTLAQSATLDEAMDSVVTYMKDNGLWDNTLIIFSSDNGGMHASGDNYPLRGFKNTTWEGGIRVPGFVTGGYLNEDRRGEALDDVLVHVTDWYPTILDAADVSLTYAKSTRVKTKNGDNHGVIKRDGRFNDVEYDNVPLDGISVWKYIQHKTELTDADSEASIYSREVLLDLNDVYCEHDSCGSVRLGQYKFVRGENVGSIDHFVDGDVWFSAYSTCKDLDVDPTLGCSSHSFQSYGCQSTDAGCLFDIVTDPCERYDMDDDVLRVKMQALLNQYQSEATRSMIHVEDALDIDDVLDNVCDSMFWCPYQEYISVTFEDSLEEDYIKLFAIHNKNRIFINDKGKKVDYHWLYTPLIIVCLTMIAFCTIALCHANRQKKKNQLRSCETSPLIETAH